MKPAPLREGLLAARNGLLASPVFQRWALRFPLTRVIARRRAAALFDLCAGFVYSQVLLACVRLRLFELLASGPRSVASLCGELGLTRDAALTLLNAAAALHLIEWSVFEERCGLGRHGAALLGIPSLRVMIEHHALLYADLQDPVALLKHENPATSLSRFWAYSTAGRPAAISAGQAHGYTSLMSATQELISAEVLDAYGFHAHRRLIDLGGGDGTFCLAAAARVPHLEVICFDLPKVAERATANFAAAGLSDRATAVAGDLRVDRFPCGADLITIVRVLHDHGDDAVLRILEAARAALPASGTLLIAEPMSGTAGVERVADAYFGLYLLAMGSGKPRTSAALAQLLRAAGFKAPRLCATRIPMNVRVLAVRPCWKSV